MKINSTYGYIRVQKNVYNLEAFYNNNKEKIQSILALKEDSDFGINFEFDDKHNVVCAFTIFGGTLLDAEVNFITFQKQLEKAFPNCQTLVKIELTEESDNEETLFNGFVKNPFPV